METMWNLGGVWLWNFHAQVREKVHLTRWNGVRCRFLGTRSALEIVEQVPIKHSVFLGRA